MRTDSPAARPDPPPTTRSRHTLLALRLTGLLVVALLATGVLPPPVGASGRGVADYSPVATDLDPGTCALLGRAWQTDGSEEGCDRDACLEPDATPTGDYNTETCVLRGALYGINLESRTCRALHRRWIAAVNRCLAVVDPGPAGVVAAAPQCSPPFTTYVAVRGRLGPDLCLTADRAATYAGLARRGHRDVDTVAFSRSRVLCELAPRFDWRQGWCRRVGPGESKRRTKSRVLVVGDSVTWRSADELTRRHRTWAVDGRPGTSIQSLGPRYREHLTTHTVPSTVVIGLGTNNDPAVMSKSRFVRAAALVPASTRVVFVTPYRDGATYGRAKARLMTRTARWMEEIAAQRRHTCVAPWQAAVARDPGLVVDGVHQTPAGEDVLARIVERAVASCSGP